MIVECHTEIVPFFALFEDPKHVPDSPESREKGRDRPATAKHAKILVVDDESLIADTVVEILKQEGFDAIALSNGLDAVETAKSYQPDIVLSDVIMPGINGIETGLRIREIVPSCRIILFSGQAATVDLLERARVQGHQFDILAKPIRPESLVQMIRSAAPRRS